MKSPVCSPGETWTGKCSWSSSESATSLLCSRDNVLQQQPIPEHNSEHEAQLSQRPCNFLKLILYDGWYCHVCLLASILPFIILPRRQHADRPISFNLWSMGFFYPAAGGGATVCTDKCLIWHGEATRAKFCKWGQVSIFTFISAIVPESVKIWNLAHKFAHEGWIVCTILASR